MIKLCKDMTVLYAVVNNLQSSKYQQLIIFILNIRFKATQQCNKRSWIASDQFCSPTQITSFKFCATKSQRNTGSSKKTDGIWNRYNLKSTRLIGRPVDFCFSTVPVSLNWFIHRFKALSVGGFSPGFKLRHLHLHAALRQPISVLHIATQIEPSGEPSTSCRALIKTERQWRNCSKVTPTPARAHDSPPAWTSPPASQGHPLAVPVSMMSASAV